MAHETLAPWAELVPDTGPMTVKELLALPAALLYPVARLFK